MKNRFIIYLCFFFSVLSQSTFAQVFPLGNTAGTGGWYKIGTLSLPQDGAVAEIRIVSGKGYNATFLQQGECTIRFRTSNSVSNNDGFYGSGILYNTGRAIVTDRVRFVQSSLSQWEVYANFATYTGWGSYISVTAVDGTWTNVFTYSATPPAGIFLDLTQELSYLSPAYFSGNVGIGTFNAPEKLSVNGKILAKEIIVKNDASWPDYVFDKSYELMPLDELNRFVKANRHLPGIPNESQIKEEGIKLSEMNSMMLKKIEELTLHLIEKDQQIRLIQKQVNELQLKLKK